MDNTWRKAPKEDSARGRSKNNFGDKILWERPEEIESKGTSREHGPNAYGPSDYGWSSRPPKSNRSTKWNYDYASGPSWGGGDGFKSIITNKFLIQTLVSLLIFMVAIGIYDRQDPESQIASRAVKYLLSVDVNFEPIMGRIVKLVFPELTEGQIAPQGGVIATTQNNTTGNSISPDPQSGGSNPAGSSPKAIGLTPDNSSLPTQNPSGINSGNNGNEQAVSANTLPVPKRMSPPLSGNIIKPYGWVFDGVDGYKRFHYGIDIEAKLGTKVHAALDGKVIKVGEDKVLGKYLQLGHSGQLTTLYAQLDKILVQEGEQVKEGDIIGQVGQSGAAEEPHLHFEVREKGEFVDPFNKMNQTGVQ